MNKRRIKTKERERSNILKDNLYKDYKVYCNNLMGKDVIVENEYTKFNKKIYAHYFTFFKGQKFKVMRIELTNRINSESVNITVMAYNIKNTQLKFHYLDLETFKHIFNK